MSLLVVAAFFLSALRAQAASFTYDDFVKLLQEKNITKIADAIAALPEELRANYTLMSDSMSAQPSSPTHPRAILFGQDAKFVVTFNGDPKHLNYDRLEVLQFREETNEFELRFIKFEGNAPQFSAKNPRSCVNCHSANPKPIWGSYQDWPGTYGNDDRISEKTAPEIYEGFQSFLAIQPQHERYRHLIRDPKHRLYPFVDADGEDLSLHLSHSLRPGNRLGNFFGRLMGRSAASLVRGSKYFQNHVATTLLGLISLGHNSLAYAGHPCLTPADLAEYDAQLSKDFQARYAMADHPKLFERLAALKEPEQIRDFILQKLLFGPDYTWDMNRFARGGVVGSPVTYFLGEVNQTSFVAARVMDYAVEMMPELKPYYIPAGADSWWTADYIRRVVAPYDTWYDATGLLYRIDTAHDACEMLLVKAKAEWALP
ncbi:MAG: hypothetical protein AB7K68_09235 [Bacteriovoracia bacterium]